MRGSGAVALLLAVSPLGPLLAGCGNGDDACSGRPETCLSLTLSGAEGVTQADQLQALVARSAKPLNPSTPLSGPQDLPFKVAILWPDGLATVSVRSYLHGQLNGVTPELTLDLSSGAHARRPLTLYPPLPVSRMDLGYSDLSRPPDLLPPPDLTPGPDLAMPDLTPDQRTADGGDGGD